MPYINLDVAYWDSKDAQRLVARLGRGADSMPLKIWCYIGNHYPETGRLTGYTSAEIEKIAGWWGKAGEALDALASPDIAVLGKDEVGYFARNWEKHNGHIVNFSIRARKGAQARWGKMLEACPKHATSNAPYLTLPNQPNQPDLTLHGKGQVGTSAEEEKQQRPPGLCDFKDNRTGVRCSMPREEGSPFCRGHIEKFRELKADRGQKRGGGLRWVGE